MMKFHKNRIDFVSVQAIALLLCATFLCTPLFAHAYFGDTENSMENVFGASSLDLDLSGGQNNNESEVTVTNIGDIPFTYTVRVETSANAFCGDIEVKYNGGTAQPPALALPLETTLEPGASFEHEFEFIYDENDHPGAACSLIYIYEAHQDGYVHGEAFFDTETSTVVLQGASVEDPVINEVYPRPDGSESIFGEWVEVYNPNGFEIDLAGWKVTEESGASTSVYTIVAAGADPATASEVRTENGQTTVSAHNYMVVLFDSETKLNNDNETVSLRKPDGTEVDSFTFSNIDSTKSVSLCPNGTGNAQDGTDPTPGSANSCVTPVP